MIRFGALCSPALRIHTLAPVSFPLTVQIPLPRIAGIDRSVAVMDAF